MPIKWVQRKWKISFLHYPKSIFIDSWPERECTVRYHCKPTSRHTHLYQGAVWMINLSPSQDGVVLCALAQTAIARPNGHWREGSGTQRKAASEGHCLCRIHEWIQILIQTDILINHRQLVLAAAERSSRVEEGRYEQTYKVSHTNSHSFFSSTQTDFFYHHWASHLESSECMAMRMSIIIIIMRESKRKRRLLCFLSFCKQTATNKSMAPQFQWSHRSSGIGGGYCLVSKREWMSQTDGWCKSKGEV